jgi:tubulin monoglycylase TTLL3/8
MKQYNLTIDNHHIITKEVFSNKIWILKPVLSSLGKGIVIFTSYKNFHKIFTQLCRTHKNWAFVEYITNPLLVRNRKFHIRLFYIVTKDNLFYESKPMLVTARDEYISADYSNTYIHDSHLANSIKGLSFPDSLEISVDLWPQIKDILYFIKDNSSTSCYDNDKKCFEVFGADLMVTDNYQIKLLELNIKFGFSGFFDDKNYQQNMLNGILQCVIDPIYTPQTIIQSNMFFTKLPIKM